MSKRNDWFACPVCTTAVRADALACPECGADDETGWSEQAAYDEVDLPDEAFDERAGLTRQTGGVFGLVALLLVAAILLLIVMGLW